MSQDVLSIKPLVPEPSEAPKLPPISIAEQYALEQKRRSGANWFLGIAGLSLVNSVLTLAGSTFGFVIGLGITQFIDVVALLIIQDYQPESPIIIQTIAFILDIAIIGFFTIFGLLARRGHEWAFLVGIGLYALDTLFTLFLEMWIGVAFHAFALFSLWNGFQATRTWNQLSKENRLNSVGTMTATAMGINAAQQYARNDQEALQRRIRTFWIPFIGILVAIVVFFAIVGQVWGWFQAQS